MSVRTSKSALVGRAHTIVAYGQRWRLRLPRVLIVAAAVLLSRSPSAANDISKLTKKLVQVTRADQLAKGAVKVVQGGTTQTITGVADIPAITSGGYVLSTVAPAAQAAGLPSLLRDALPAALQNKGVQLEQQLLAVEAVTDEAVSLVPWVIDKTGLMFDAAQNAYAGVCLVALSDVNAPEARHQLSSLIQVGITATGASQVEPRELTISDVGQWHEVVLLVPDPREAAFPVSVSLANGGKPSRIDLPVLRPQIRVDPTNVPVLGWGIGTTKLVVQAVGVVSPNLLKVTLRSIGGTVEPDPVPLDAQGKGEATLRSSAAEQATVSAVVPGGGPGEPVIVAFQPPWSFLLIAATGGLAGAFLRRKGRQSWGRALSIGTVCAVVMTLAYAVGFTQWVAAATGVERIASSGEALVFVLGAIAALVGVTGLVPSLGKKKASD